MHRFQRVPSFFFLFLGKVNLVTSKHIADAFEAAARKKLELMSAVSDETEWPNNNKSKSLADFKSPRDGIESRGGSDDRMGGGPVATLPPAAPHNSRPSQQHNSRCSSRTV